MADNHPTNKVGRPVAITNEVVQKLDSIFKVGGTVDEAVTYAGIGRSTYFDRLASDDDFRTKMEAAQHYADVVAKNVVVDAIVKQKDLATAKWWLEKRQFNQPLVEVNQQFNNFEVVGQDGKQIDIK